MEYFVESVLSIKAVAPVDATHYAICNGGKIRYLIALNSVHAKKRLANNISAYSGKLNILMRLLGALPYSVLSVAKLGLFVQVKPAEQVNTMLAELNCGSWNGIIGSYVEKQKVVLQCFDGAEPQKHAVYMKVGGSTSEQEMLTETNYLEHPIQSSLFYSPRMLRSQARKDGHAFNIQVTEEFVGTKMPPKVDESIYRIFREISASKPTILEEGTEKVFSHGDFTPWNIKKDGQKYVVFDWEYAGYRFYGFDLIHYMWQIENKLNKLAEHESIMSAIIVCKEWDSKLRSFSDQELEEQYFMELHSQFGETL